MHNDLAKHKIELCYVMFLKVKEKAIFLQSPVYGCTSGDQIT